MTEFRAPNEQDLSIIPDDLTVPQFVLDAQHPARPPQDPNMPWLIEDATGRAIGFEEVRTNRRSVGSCP